MSNEIIRLQNLLTKLNNLVGKKTEVDDSSSSSLTHPYSQNTLMSMKN